VLDDMRGATVFCTYRSPFGIKRGRQPSRSLCPHRLSVTIPVVQRAVLAAVPASILYRSVNFFNAGRSGIQKTQ
jgi:hypothetical protein